jgi:hypothetical protein
LGRDIAIAYARVSLTYSSRHLLPALKIAR